MLYVVVRVWQPRLPHPHHHMRFPVNQYCKFSIASHINHWIEGEQAHFLTLTFWESSEAIQTFAGAEIEKAKYYPEDHDFLLELETTVAHYEVFTTAEG